HASLSRSPSSLWCSLLRRPPPSSLLPYTTLFRSCALILTSLWQPPPTSRLISFMALLVQCRSLWTTSLSDTIRRFFSRMPLAGRSEEHTSELQSRENLVCRLLLEKKEISRFRWRS